MNSELPLRILYVSYPLLTVSEASAGGAEQMLWTLEREMARLGMETMVAASAGSRVTGKLHATGEPCTAADDFERRNREHQNAIIDLVRQRRRTGRAFDLIHDKSGSFWTRAHEIDAPVLATLHLPRHFYAEDVFERIPDNVIFNCVSHSQAQSFRDIPGMLGVAPNGIALDKLNSCGTEDRLPREGLLWLGRICEEKGPHLALDIARMAGEPITLAGQIYPFSYHQQFFDREVRPRLEKGSNARFVPNPSMSEKVRMFRAARALLITSRVAETSSLVAMEAAACGTPVVAFARGALPEVVQRNVTGYLVNDIDGAVDALGSIDAIDRQECIQHAKDSFSSIQMASRYRSLYSEILQRNTSMKMAG